MAKQSFKASMTSDMLKYHFNLPLERRLQLFSEYGFEYIHWCDNWDDEVSYSERDIELYCRLIKDMGLKCIDVHGTATNTVRIDAPDGSLRERYVELLENRIRFCAAAEGDSVVIHPPSGDPGSPELSENLSRSLHVFEETHTLCEELGVNLSVENVSVAAKETLEFYFERFPPDFVGFCFDSGHANVQKNFNQLETFGDRLKALHLHDNRGERDDHQPPFWGIIDWKPIVEWIKKSGYSKPINFEITYYPHLFTGTMEEYMRISTEAVRKLMKLF